MNSAGRPKGGFHKFPSFLGSKTRFIGRIPSQTALINKGPLMGSLSPRGGAPNNNDHPAENASRPPPTDKVASTSRPQLAEKVLPTPTPKPEGGGVPKGNNHPLPQTSFHQSEPPPTFSTKSEEDGSPKTKNHESPQTSFHQSNPTQPTPTQKSEGGGLPKTTDRSLPRPSDSPHSFSTTLANPPPQHSTSETGHSAPGRAKPFSAKSSATADGLTSSPPKASITPQPHDPGFPPNHGSSLSSEQSLTDGKHSDGHIRTEKPPSSQSHSDNLSPTQSRNNNPFPIQSKPPSDTQTVNAPFPIRSHSNKLAGHTEHSDSPPLTTETSRGSVHTAAPTASPFSHPSKEPPVESRKGGSGGHSGIGAPLPSQNHPNNNPPSFPGHTTDALSTKSQPDSSHQTAPSQHQQHPKPSRLTTKFGPPPFSQITQPVQQSQAPSPFTPKSDPPQKTDKPLPNSPAKSPKGPSHRTTKVASPSQQTIAPSRGPSHQTHPLIPIPIHISKTLPAPLPTEAAPHPQHPEKPQPAQPHQSPVTPSRPTVKSDPHAHTNKPAVVDISPTRIPEQLPHTVISSDGTLRLTNAPIPTISSETSDPPISPESISRKVNEVQQSGSGSMTTKPQFADTPESSFTATTSSDNSGRGPWQKRPTLSTPRGVPGSTPSGSSSVSSTNKAAPSTKTAAIVGGVLGVLLGLLILGLLVVGFCFYRRKLRRTQRRLQLYEKSGDVAPPLYAPFGRSTIYDPRTMSDHSFNGGHNMQGYFVPSVPIAAKPFSNPPTMQEVYGGNQMPVGQNNQAYFVSNAQQNTNPFSDIPSTNQASANEQFSVNGGETAKEMDHRNQSSDSAQSLEDNRPWATFTGNSSSKSVNARLSQGSTETTLSVDAADRCDLDFDPAKLIRTPTPGTIGLAM